MPYALQIFFQVFFSYLATIAFAVMINAPRRVLNACGISGAVGWITYWTLFQLGTGKTLANLVGAFLAGVCGIIFSRMQKMPVIIYNIPALVPLVPGATAYQAIRVLVLDNLNEALQLLLRVIMVAGAIAVGFMLAQLMATITAQKRYQIRRKRSSDLDKK